jgi:cobalamin 5'-phosphate synthase/cobalamin synthase
LLAAFAFLTQIPVPGASELDAADVAKSGAFFPLVGLLIGGVYALAALTLRSHLPGDMLAATLVVLDVLLTGALHFDGLADMADGFGGGRTKEDVLRIMRDHAIGSYGGVALALMVALKVAAYSALLKQTSCIPALILTPALGRWSILLLTANLPYARPTSSVAQGMGKQSLAWGTCIIVASVSATISLRGWLATSLVILVSAAFGFYCKRRIGGITGDTLGANLQLCETASLLTFLWR